LSGRGRAFQRTHLLPHVTPGQDAIADGHKGDRGQRQDQGCKADLPLGQRSMARHLHSLIVV
jgi:hypothetical protein